MWLPWVSSTKGVDDIVPFIKVAQKQYVSGEGFKEILMFQGNYAGFTGYYNVDLNIKSASIGYWLGEPYQNKGIMARALKVFIDYAFNKMGLNKMEILIAEENFKSRALPEKYGFKEEGIIRDAE
ncbi:GNAT family N-acetyltransferase [Clostridium tagluense]|uniref:GNAT family N-acetyltransferase n=1 Tax=Clostridium tagluense TaxID=360422 RepID=UPI001CF37FF6|nr:GNAT family protein [Clostridium tagluense]MCB2299250.1 GNAT family N-acetyltransferase [Clostridium tagluense]